MLIDGNRIHPADLETVTTSDNQRMLAVFQKRGFDLVPDPESSVVEVSKNL